MPAVVRKVHQIVMTILHTADTKDNPTKIKNNALWQQAFSYIFLRLIHTVHPQNYASALSAGAAEYTDWISAEG